MRCVLGSFAVSLCCSLRLYDVAMRTWCEHFRDAVRLFRNSTAAATLLPPLLPGCVLRCAVICSTTWYTRVCIRRTRCGRFLSLEFMPHVICSVKISGTWCCCTIKRTMRALYSIYQEICESVEVVAQSARTCLRPLTEDGLITGVLYTGDSTSAVHRTDISRGHCIDPKETVSSKASTAAALASLSRSIDTSTPSANATTLCPERLARVILLQRLRQGVIQRPSQWSRCVLLLYAASYVIQQ